MNYDGAIITEVAFSDDPALFTRSKPVRLRTSRSEVSEAIAEGDDAILTEIC